MLLTRLATFAVFDVVPFAAHDNVVATPAEVAPDTAAPTDAVPVDPFDVVVPVEAHADTEEAVNTITKNTDNKIAAFFLSVCSPIYKSPIVLIDTI